MELNFTPIRTSKNYGINSINLNIDNQKTANFNKNNQKYLQKFNNFQYDIDNNVELNFKSSLLNSNTLSTDIKFEAEHYNNFACTTNISNSTTKTIKFKFDFDENNSDLINVFNLNIKNNVKTQIIFEFTTKNEITNYSNLNININVNENAEANIIFYNELGDDSTNLVSIQSNVEKNAKLSVSIVDIACKNSIFNYYSKIIGKNGISNLQSLYIGDKESIIDLNYLIELIAPNCKTNMNIIGSIVDNAIKHFKGTIDFKKGCPKSVGSEDEFCMLLSKTAKTKSLPMILCTEEDVDGKHSSSVGKVDEKQLFYIMSRGLSKLEATRLVVKAKFNKIINSLFDEEIKTKILNTIDRKIK